MTVNYVERSTTGLLEITTDPLSNPSKFSWEEEKISAWLGEICNPQVDVSGIVSGSGYQDGVYFDVDLTRAASTQSGGIGLKGTVTVTGGGVSNVEITTKGNGYKTGDFVLATDLTQVGGTGSGFQIPLSSANAEVGYRKRPQDRTTDGYMVGHQLGVERLDAYTMGLFVHRSSSTSTLNIHAIYQYQENNPTSNNGYGLFNSHNSQTMSMWTDSLGGNYQMGFWSCTDPGNEFFLIADSAYNSGWGLFKAVQDPGKAWPDRQLASPWFRIHFTNSAVYYRGIIPYIGTTAFVGNKLESLDLPDDAGILFNKFPLRGKAYSMGITPDRFYTGTGTQGWGHVYQDGPDTYRRLSNAFYVKMN